MTIFDKSIPKMCKHCTFAIDIDDETCLCKHKSVVTYDYKCSKYKYDPLRRVPAQKPDFNPSTYSHEDFKL